MQLRTMFAGVLMAGVGLAWADPPAPAPSAAVAETRLKCRTFPTDLGAEVDTRDTGTDLGRWVLDLEDRGWIVHTIDWEVGQKPTGFPQGYTHVCLTPVRATQADASGG